MLTRIKFAKFTAFADIDVALGPGINVFIGENGTGKTHLLKAAYAACDITKTSGSLARKLVGVFMPYEGRIGRLVHRTGKSTNGSVEVHRGRQRVRSSFSSHTKEPESAKVKGRSDWAGEPIECAYIPVKEMLANAPGFRSLYAGRMVHFEEVYADIVDRAYLPILRGARDARRKRLLEIIQDAIEGKVATKGETFFLRNKQGELEFSLLSEGMRKLGLLWLLIQNGTLLDGSVLFWDEPETNLNPRVIGTLAEILLELQRLGVQILLATHDYVVLKELDLRMKKQDRVTFHVLWRGDDGLVQHRSAEEYLQVQPNVISETLLQMYDRDVERDLETD